MPVTRPVGPDAAADTQAPAVIEADDLTRNPQLSHSAQHVKLNFDTTADFSVVKTFAINLGTRWNHQISEQRVTAEFETTLSEKG